MRHENKSRLNETVPRYTSYPTAPHFHAGITADTVREWILRIEREEPISLYLHVPFCDRLCWFCACHTKQTRQYEPVASYVRSLCREIETVSGLIGNRAPVRAIHLGGGSPTMLKPEDIMTLGATLRGSFRLVDEPEISVEIDPNDMTDERLDAFAAIGMTRASLGVQDFDPKVQKAINRDQSFELTESVVNGLRERGIASINLDLLYGLPHQTCATLEQTVRMALTLAHYRIALFGYAHVPWFKKHQTMIADEWLPLPEERYAQSMLAARLIAEAGYEAIGIDHFARPEDSLAAAAREGRLRRNFQGYTDERCDTLIGLGASSISRFQQGYAQNQPATSVYQRTVDEGGLATVRGIELSAEDHARAWIIERLMCDFAFDGEEAAVRFGPVARPLIAEAALLSTTGRHPWLVRRGDVFVVPEEHRPLVRTVAARFDSYLKQGEARHSAAV